MIRRSFYGCRLDNISDIDLNNPFEGKRIMLQPWPFGNQRKVNEELKNTIRTLDRFQRVSRLEEEETRRLMYVGMTRARDILITTTNKNQSPAWLNSVLGHQQVLNNIASLPEGQIGSDLFQLGEKILLTKKNFGDDTDYPELGERTTITYLKKGPASQDDPKYRAPSSESSDQEVKAGIIKDFNFRIEIAGGFANRESELGNCLHDIFYLYDPGKSEKEFLPKISKIIENFQMTGFLPNHQHILTSVSNLYSFLQDNFSDAVITYKELPLQMNKEGYVYRGEADLVWETEKEIILVDYKSFPGKKSHVTNPVHDKYAGKYAGQLFAYRDMIEATHPAKKKVNHMLIYYSLLGVVVRIS